MPKAEIGKEYESLWNEYQYRHDRIWKLFFSVIIATTTIVLIPYTKIKIVEGLSLAPKLLLLTAPLLIVIFSWVAIIREIDLFDKIKDIFREYQRIFFPIDHRNNSRNEKKGFSAIWAWMITKLNFRKRVIVLMGFLFFVSLTHCVLGICEEVRGKSSRPDAGWASIAKELKNIRMLIEKDKSEGARTQAQIAHLDEKLKEMMSTPAEIHMTRTVLTTGSVLIIVGTLILALIPLARSHLPKIMPGIMLLSGGVTLLGGLSLINLKALNLLKVEFLTGGAGDTTKSRPAAINIDKITIEWPSEGVRIGDDEKHGSIHFEHLGDIGTFAPGELDLADKSKVGEFIAEVNKRVADRHRWIFMLIAGKVDQRAIGKSLQNMYESNFALAQRRAVWVKDHLKGKIKGLDFEKMIPIAMGPEHFPDENDDRVLENDRLEKDRIVRCYGLWIKTAPKQGAVNPDPTYQ